MSENNYLYFDQWIMPILKEMLVEQNTKVCRLISAFTHAKNSKTKSHIYHYGRCCGLRWGHFLSGCSMDSFQDDPPTGQGDQQPRIQTADYAVYVNTAQEFDGCDSGASPDEAVSWGKLTQDAKYVKVLHNTP